MHLAKRLLVSPVNASVKLPVHLGKGYHEEGCKVEPLDPKLMTQSLVPELVNLSNLWMSVHPVTCNFQKHLQGDSQLVFRNPTKCFSVGRAGQQSMSMEKTPLEYSQHNLISSVL